MSYVDGFLIPVPDARKEEYRAHEAEWWPWFQARGASALVVCWGDNVPAGTRTDFRRAVDLQEGETVVFAWMVWPDKATRDKAFENIDDDPDMTTMQMPFDGKRMVFGGFVPIVTLGGPIIP